MSNLDRGRFCDRMAVDRKCCLAIQEHHRHHGCWHQHNNGTQPLSSHVMTGHGFTLVSGMSEKPTSMPFFVLFTIQSPVLIGRVLY
ncbi:hypothetical protein BKA67DRAFT_586408 [Truncatella angustata]|uniref:Uncharacterized protein n=1 Tax=Truncatella angustata TaxID=152316 RepID=A0A9P8RMA5_9PEZI|nr:uncharacterized protein BKA67DRAFT_586408 [Truncatella angustata]KAH6645731.1 hypothetical protein BKA67DRAFT_586408 [Truncatella angustata]